MTSSHITNAGYQTENVALAKSDLSKLILPPLIGGRKHPARIFMYYYVLLQILVKLLFMILPRGLISADF